MTLQARKSQFSPPWLMPVQREIITRPFCNRRSHPATVPAPRQAESVRPQEAGVCKSGFVSCWAGAVPGDAEAAARTAVMD